MPNNNISCGLRKFHLWNYFMTCSLWFNSTNYFEIILWQKFFKKQNPIQPLDGPSPIPFGFPAVYSLLISFFYLEIIQIPKPLFFFFKFKLCFLLNYILYCESESTNIHTVKFRSVSKECPDCYKTSIFTSKNIYLLSSIFKKDTS